MKVTYYIPLNGETIAHATDCDSSVLDDAGAHFYAADRLLQLLGQEVGEHHFREGGGWESSWPILFVIVGFGNVWVDLETEPVFRGGRPVYGPIREWWEEGQFEAFCEDMAGDGWAASAPAPGVGR